jgi:hypothetical protein
MAEIVSGLWFFAFTSNIQIYDRAGASAALTKGLICELPESQALFPSYISASKKLRRR